MVVESLEGLGDGSEGVDQYSSHHLHKAEQPHHQISFGIDFELGQRVVDLLLTHCRIYTSTVSLLFNSNPYFSFSYSHGCIYGRLLPIIRWFVIVILIIVVQGERVGMLEVFGFDDNKSKPCDKGRDRTAVACGCSAVVLLRSCVVLYSIDVASL